MFFCLTVGGLCSKITSNFPVGASGEGMTRMAVANALQAVHEAIEAHGGMDYWNSLSALEADISARGFLFLAKRRPVLERVRMRASTTEPRFAFLDYPNPGQTAELIGNDEVRILDSAGRVLARRENPRQAFHGVRRLFKWDELDFIYFGGYATWNYLTAPFLLMRKGFIIEALEPLRGAFEHLTRLLVTFPDDLPTHCHKQIFYFDEERMLRRLDYTAEVVGNWAHAAHLCEDYRSFGGLKAPTRRRVLPLFFGHGPMPGPTLVELNVHDIRPVGN
jgi:hypothetical protein